MTPLLSIRRSTNKTSFNTLIVLTLASGLHWKTTRRMGPSPSWAPLSYQRLMVAYPSLCTGNQHIQTSTYSGIAIITSQPKFSVINTLSHRAKTVCSRPELLQQEVDHLRKAFTKCKYPKWALDKVEKRLSKSTSETIDGVNNQGTTGAQAVTNEVKTKGHIVIPYSQGLCKSIKKISGRYGIQTHFKGSSTIKNLLVSPKDIDPMVNQSGAIDWYQCGDLGCDDEYIGEPSRTFGEGYKEHLKDSSPIHQQSNQTGHPASHNKSQIIGREGHNLARNIKESIFIRINNPTLNNNIGKFNLPHIWDRVLLNTPGLNLKRQVNNNITQFN